MKQINESVFHYFGINEAIIQNKYDEEGFNAFFEGKIEPFALQLSLVLSNMMFTPREISFGNALLLTANRLQYASNKTKLEMSTQLFDRGLLCRNDIMDLWCLPHVEDGDKYYIRKEYADLQDLGKELEENAENTGSGIPGNGASAEAGGNGASKTD
jgi:hypothetical protein